ncbi:hypothetical protein FOA52_008899, partial [Chlamydomonas sp. UWO 241]
MHCVTLRVGVQRPACAHGRRAQHGPVRVVRSAALGCKFVGVGSCTPSTIITNDDLSSLVDTNDAWISSRTGIRQRRVLGAGESLTSISAQAGARALEMAGTKPEEIDIVLFASSSPDDLFGGACQVQAALGCKNAVAFDITAACSGFVIALITAAQYIRGGSAKKVLVVGADALSRFVDWRDRGSCILFGDGSGAIVMVATDGPCGLLGFDMHSDGHGQKSLNCNFEVVNGVKPLLSESASAQGAYRNLAMVGADVYKFAVKSVPSVIEKALEKSGLSKSDVDWLVMHQANQRIMDACAERLELPK